VKVCCPELDVPLLVEELELALLEAGFNKAQGTATCFPPLAELLVALLLVLLELGVLLELVPPELLTDRMAKSIFPDVGLIKTSLMVPRLSPEELVTLALVSSLARTS